MHGFSIASVDNRGSVISGGKVTPRFFFRPIKNELRSKEVGHPIYDDVEYVELYIHGDSENRPVRRVKDEDKQNYAQFYQAFLNHHKKASEGTPLEYWPAITRAQVETLKAVEIFNVEGLRDAKGDLLKMLGDDYSYLQTKAKAYLDRHSDEIAIENYAAENAALKEQLKFLEEQISDLRAELKFLKKNGE